MPACLIGVEACVRCHHLSRRLRLLVPRCPLMPAKYVRATRRTEERLPRREAITEAVQRPTMKFVPRRGADQLDLQALHRVVSVWSASGPGHQSDPRLPLGAWGRGAARAALLRAELPGHSRTGCAVLSARMVHLIEDLAGDGRRLDERIEGLSGESLPCRARMPVASG